MTTDKFDALRTYGAALDLDAYMQFRAESECQKYDLGWEFFAKALDTGVRVFFGVVVGDDGLLEEDTQRPDIFMQWQDQIFAQWQDQRDD
jgi:hypothetical protein